MVANGFDGHVEEFELSLGHVTGVRGFMIDGLGRLTGVTVRSVFRDGANVATCEGSPVDDIADHTCGYYAYFDQDETKHFYGAQVGAIVRGYGRTVVGTKGFRAEKADLQALFPIDTVGPKITPGARSVPSGKPSQFRSLYPRAYWFLRHGTNGLLDGIALVLGILLLSVAPVLTADLLVRGFPVAAWLSLFLGLSLALWSGGFLRRMWHGGLAAIDLKYPSLPMRNVANLKRLCRGDISPVPSPSPKIEKHREDHFARLAVLYPDVPQYASFQDALKDYPLTSPEEHKLPEPSPENDPDFWDRKITSISSDGQSFASGGLITRGSGFTASFTNSPTGRLVNSLPPIQASRGRSRSNLAHNPFLTCGCSLCQ